MEFGRNAKNILQWQVTVQFNPLIKLHPEYVYEYEYMSNSILYSYISQSSNDNSNNEILETLSNFHCALIKGFLNYHMIRINRMLSSLTRSD